MNKKLARNVAQPFMIIGAAVMVILSVIIMWNHLWLGIGCLAVSGLVYLFHMRFTINYVERSLEKFERSVLKEREDFMDAFSGGSPLLLCVVNRTGEIE